MDPRLCEGRSAEFSRVPTADYGLNVYFCVSPRLLI